MIRNQVKFRSPFAGNEFKLTRDDEDIPVLVPVVRSMSSSAVADGESRREFTDLLEEKTRSAVSNDKSIEEKKNFPMREACGILRHTPADIR